MITRTLIAFLSLGVAGLHAESPERIITAGGSITEMVVALGAGDQIVAVDSSSVFPPELAELPQVGYVRMLSAEGLLSQSPTLLITDGDAGPPTVLEQIKNAGVRVETIPAGHTLEAAITRIQAVGAILGVEDKAAELSTRVKAEVTEVLNSTDTKETPSVLFVYARAGGTLNVAGQDTAADDIIQLAGGRNAISGYTGYKPLTAEAAVAAAPDIILLTSRGFAEMGGVDGVLTHPGLRQTPAAKDRRIVAMDDLLLLGFGPRLGEAVRELGSHFHEAPTSEHPVSAALTR